MLFLFVAQRAFSQFNSIEFIRELPSVKVAEKRNPLPKKIEPEPLTLFIEESKIERNVLLASLPLQDFKLTSAYGYRSDPFSHQRKFHRGIDLKTNRSKVLSMLHGKVVSVGTDPLLGNFIKVQHGKYESVYGHLSKVLVSPQESVLPGSVLGVSGSTGKATGDHLHLTIKRGKEYLNPTLFIQMISKITTKEELITYLSNH